jgi:hypothetical protein
MMNQSSSLYNEKSQFIRTYLVLIVIKKILEAMQMYGKNQY